MREEINSYRRLFIFTVLILLVLVVIMIYIFAVKPTVNGYVVKKQIEASDFIIGTIINQVQQQGYVQLTYLNQSITLVPYTGQTGSKN